jgi:hypothetical protein
MAFEAGVHDCATPVRSGKESLFLGKDPGVTPIVKAWGLYKALRGRWSALPRGVWRCPPPLGWNATDDSRD